MADSEVVLDPVALAPEPAPDPFLVVLPPADELITAWQPGTPLIPQAPSRTSNRPGDTPDRLPVPVGQDASAPRPVIPAAAQRLAASPIPVAAVQTHEHPNPPGQHFCGECGARLFETPRWGCGHENPDSNRFCGQCGQAAFSAPVSGAGVAVELAAQVSPQVHQLSPEQRAERDRAHSVALRQGAAMPQVRYEGVSPGADGQWLYIMEDGLTAFGKVWYKGEEMFLTRGSQRWDEAQVWMWLDDFAQMARWGVVRFRLGRWPGLPYSAGAGQFEALRAVNKEAARRGARVPVPSQDELAQADVLAAARAGAVPAAVL